MYQPIQHGVDQLLQHPWVLVIFACALIGMALVERAETRARKIANRKLAKSPSPPGHTRSSILSMLRWH